MYNKLACCIYPFLRKECHYSYNVASIYVFSSVFLHPTFFFYWHVQGYIIYRSLQVYQRSNTLVGHRVFSDFTLKIVRPNSRTWWVLTLKFVGHFSGASRTFWEEYVRPESMIVYTLGVYCMLKLCLLKVAILDGGQGHQTQFWKLTT